MKTQNESEIENIILFYQMFGCFPDSFYQKDYTLDEAERILESIRMYIHETDLEVLLRILENEEILKLHLIQRNNNTKRFIGRILEHRLSSK